MQFISYKIEFGSMRNRRSKHGREFEIHICFRVNFQRGEGSIFVLPFEGCVFVSTSTSCRKCTRPDSPPTIFVRPSGAKAQLKWSKAQVFCRATFEERFNARRMHLTTLRFIRGWR